MWCGAVREVKRAIVKESISSGIRTEGNEEEGGLEEKKRTKPGGMSFFATPSCTFPPPSFAPCREGRISRLTMSIRCLPPPGTALFAPIGCSAPSIACRCARDGKDAGIAISAIPTTTKNVTRGCCRKACMVAQSSDMIASFGRPVHLSTSVRRTASRASSEAVAGRAAREVAAEGRERSDWTESMAVA
jgi:hypothetical protein